MAILWALATAFCFACGIVLVRQALPHTNAVTAAWFVVGFNAIALCPIFFFYPFPDLSSHIAVDIALTAFLAPFLARIFQYLSLDAIGVTRTAVIVGTTPVLAVLLAVTFLGEPVTVPLLAGALATAVGVMVIVYEKTLTSTTGKVYLVLPLAAALAFASRDVFGRVDMADFHHPLVIAALVPSAAFIFFSGLLLVGPGRFRFTLRPGAMRFLVPAGVAYTLSDLFTFLALGSGQVVVVAPALHSTPLFALFLSHLFLREQERLSKRIVIGVVVVLTGVALTVVDGAN